MSINQIDKMIHNLEGLTGAPPLKMDPDDPWFSLNLVQSQTVSKVHCKDCGYYYTTPFERECVICKFKPGAVQVPQFELNVEEIKKRALPSSLAASATSSSSSSSSSSSEAPTEAPAAKQKHPTQPQAVDRKVYKLANTVVAKLTNCKKHPEADKLIIADANLGGGVTKTLVTGLIPSYSPEDLEGRLVCTVINLKPKTMVGVLGHVMLFAATDPREEHKYVLLDPPAGSEAGDKIYPEGVDLGGADAAAQIPPKQWEKVVSGFKIRGEKAWYFEFPLVTARGVITCLNVPDNSDFH